MQGFLYSLALLTSFSSALSLPTIQVHLMSSQEALEALGQYPHPISAIDFSSGTIKVRSSFDVNASRNVSSNAPPRRIQFCGSFEHVRDEMIRLIEDLIKATNVAQGTCVSEWLVSG